MILPRVAPVRARADKQSRGAGHRRFLTTGLDEYLPIISRAEAAQGEVVGAEMVNSSRQVGELPTHQIEVDMVEGAGAGCGAKIHLPASVCPAFGDTSRKKQELGQRQ